MGDYRKLGKNALWMTVGNFASKLLSFFLTPLYTYILTTSEYGAADIIVTTVTLLAPVLTLQINEAVIRFSLDRNVDKKQTFSFGILLVFIGFVILILFSPLLCIIDTIKQFYWLFLFYYLGTTLNTLLSQYAKGISQVHHYAISGIVHTASVIGCNLLFLLKFKLGIEGYVLSLVIGCFVSISYLSVTIKAYKCFKLLHKCDLSVLKSMLKYSVPMIPNSLSWWVSNSSDKYMLKYLSGDSVQGVYSISYKIPSLLSTINTIFMSAWQLSAVDDFGSKKSSSFFSDMYYRLTAFDALVVSFLIVFSRLLGRVLYAKEFFPAWKYSAVLCFAFYFSSLSAFLATVYTTSKKTKALFYTSVIGAITNIVLNIFLIPRFSALGAAIATVASYLIVWVIRFFHVDSVFSFDKNIIHNVVPSSIMVAQIILIYQVDPICDIIAVVLFLLMMSFFGKFIVSTLKFFTQLIKRKLKNGKV